MKQNMLEIRLIDKYIFQQLIEFFLLGVVIFTSIMFASDAFLTLVKQITAYGIPFKIAFLLIVLKLPFIVVFTIPLAVMMATVYTFNRLNNNSEITVMRACGISISRLALPVLIFGISTAVLSFFINEYVVPTANYQARNVTIWALAQKNVPKGRETFSIKELNRNGSLRRLFYVDKYRNKTLEGITVLDVSKQNVIQIIQSKYAETTPDYWQFKEGSVYTISNLGKVLNTAVFNKLKLFNRYHFSQKKKDNTIKELNFYGLIKYIKNKQSPAGNINVNNALIQLNEKFALPLTSILVAIIGVPLAINPPRSRFNKGYVYSILIIFLFYIARAFFLSLGEAGTINAVLSAWLPFLLLACLTAGLFYKKAYLI